MRNVSDGTFRSQCFLPKRRQARNAGASALMIDGESELDPAILEGHETVGLTAGASTPEKLVQDTVARLAALGYDRMEEITVAREDVHFRLPKEVTAS